MHAPRMTCVICGVPLVAPDERARPVCQNAACRWRYDTAPRRQSCLVCGRPLAVEELAVGVCASPECRRTWFVDRPQQRRREQRAAIEAQARELRRQRVRATSGRMAAPPDAYTIAIIPQFTGRLGRLPRRRRRFFRERLRELVEEAFAPEAAGAAGGTGDVDDRIPPRPEPSPEAAAVLGAACTRCRGHCCRRGDTHAYLSTATIRRYRAAHPEQGPAEVLAAYEAHLAGRSYRGSCVFHGAHGCTLPREMRSNVCNRFFCEGLRDFTDALVPGEPVRAFFATAVAGQVQAGAFVDRDAVRVVRRRSAPAEVAGVG
ncbi:MAG TPA: hypothetical protein VFS08_17640 [Gemmatimonadaceae bacterium]|nr:hypothetical protein [Gemmatimonadaceae bacterium]